MNHQTNSSVTDIKCFEVRFDGFAGLPTTKSNDNFTDSPEFTCFGHRWSLRLYPGGARRSDDGMVAVFLRHIFVAHGVLDLWGAIQDGVLDLVIQEGGLAARRGRWRRIGAFGLRLDTLRGSLLVSMRLFSKHTLFSIPRLTTPV